MRTGAKRVKESTFLKVTHMDPYTPVPYNGIPHGFPLPLFKM